MGGTVSCCRGPDESDCLCLNFGSADRDPPLFGSSLIGLRFFLPSGLTVSVDHLSVGRGGPGCHSLSLLRQTKEAKKGDRTANALRVPNCALQKMGKR